MPPLQQVISRLTHLFREAMSKSNGDCEEVLAKLQANSDAVECVTILSIQKAMDIPVKMHFNAPQSERNMNEQGDAAFLLDSRPD